MSFGRRCDGHSIHFSYQITPVDERSYTVFGGNLRCGFGARIADADEFDAALLGEFGIIACVVAAQASNADRSGS